MKLAFCLMFMLMGCDSLKKERDCQGVPNSEALTAEQCREIKMRQLERMNGLPKGSIVSRKQTGGV